MAHSSTFMTSAYPHTSKLDPYLEEKQLEVDRTYQELQNLIGDLD